MLVTRDCVRYIQLYSEPVKTTKDGSGMAGFRRLDNRTCDRVLDLLEVVCLRLREVVVKKITVIKFGMNDGGGNSSSRGCSFGIENSKYREVG